MQVGQHNIVFAVLFEQGQKSIYFPRADQGKVRTHCHIACSLPQDGELVEVVDATPLLAGLLDRATDSAACADDFTLQANRVHHPEAVAVGGVLEWMTFALTRMFSDHVASFKGR